MPQPNSNPHITSPRPQNDLQPYDAASDAAQGPWVKPDDVTDLANGIAGADQSFGPWKQT